jgi:RND family efflux transporter MFP subunit
VEQKELLNQLRIDRSADASPGGARVWLIVSLVSAAIVAAAAVTYFALRTGAPEVELASARSMASVPASASVLDATGYVTARRQATVSAKITGKVREVLIEEGMAVDFDQVLATLDDTEARAQFALSQAQLEAARAQVAEVRTQVANAEREYQRQSGMAEKKLTSAQALDAARTQAETMRARLAATQRSVNVAEESLRLAQVQLDNTIVRAPFAGVVTVKAAQPGEMISPISAGGGFTRTGIGTIVDMDSLEIQVDVNEAFINRVTAGQPVDAVLNAYPDWRIPAEVIAIIPTADRTRATVKVRIAIKEKDPRIVPEMGVRVAFLNERKAAGTEPAPPPPGVLVPANAIAQVDGKDYVFVYRDEKVERRAVSLGQTLGESRQVLSGVRAGEQVVLAPAPTLNDGDAVAPAKR